MGNEKEIWENILGYENLYQASNLGRIKSLERLDVSGHRREEKILKLTPCGKYEYLMLILSKKKQRKCHYVHRLVLEAFIGPCPPGMQCRHLDGNTQNNKLENLKWGTPRENHSDSIKHGTHKCLHQNGTDHHGAKLIEDQVLAIRKLSKTGKYAQRELAKRFNISQSQISDIVNGKKWKHI